jgi:hypothetical protein
MCRTDADSSSRGVSTKKVKRALEARIVAERAGQH